MKVKLLQVVKNKYVLIGAGLVVLVILGLLAWLVAQPKASNKAPESQQQEQAQTQSQAPSQETDQSSNNTDNAGTTNSERVQSAQSVKASGPYATESFQRVGGTSSAPTTAPTGMPSFGLVQGPMTRINGAEYNTFRVTFTITPSPNFGNPEMTMRLYDIDYMGAIIPGSCLDTGQQTKTFIYNGQNTFTLDCVIKRIQPTPPGTLPPAQNSPGNFVVSVDGKVNGQYIKGPLGIKYGLPDDFDE
ncbi:MAG TPA: hypothetical protein VLA88_05570 [Candidatus Saccharimonadales bacterium]|nr:hypothetical protein [Candidatus Saccharimonadales bacterium]